MLRAYLHNDYDDDGRVDNDDVADECSYLSCRFWMMTLPDHLLHFLESAWLRVITKQRRAQSQTDICIKVMFGDWCHPLMIPNAGQVTSLNSVSEPQSAEMTLSSWWPHYGYYCSEEIYNMHVCDDKFYKSQH